MASVTSTSRNGEPTESPTELTTASPGTFRPDRAPFSETHRRTVAAPLDEVWRAAIDVTAREIRSFGPLIALRGLPSRVVRGRSGVAADASAGVALLELFESEGFVHLATGVDDGVRRVEYGAAGRFWSPAGNRPIRFSGPDEFARFDDPGHAVIWFDLVAREIDGGTELSTTTLVWGTDRSAELRFAPYWALIRLPSGLIRRSWLAAIDRRTAR